MPQQFDIVENLNPARRVQYPFLVVLQHDRIASLRSVVAAPLVDGNAVLPVSRLHVSIVMNERHYLLLIEELAAVLRNSLGRVIASAEADRYEIVRALDFLFTGI